MGKPQARAHQRLMGTRRPGQRHRHRAFRPQGAEPEVQPHPVTSKTPLDIRGSTLEVREPAGPNPPTRAPEVTPLPAQVEACRVPRPAQEPGLGQEGERPQLSAHPHPGQYLNSLQSKPMLQPCCCVTVCELLCLPALSVPVCKVGQHDSEQKEIF